MMSGKMCIMGGMIGEYAKNAKSVKKFANKY